MSEPIQIRDFLLDDELALWDAWSNDAIGDTSFSAGVDSRSVMRRRHGAKGLDERERAAVSAFGALSKAGGTNPNTQCVLLTKLAWSRSRIGPTWAWAVLGFERPMPPTDGWTMVARDAGDGWHLYWLTGDDDEGEEIPWPFGDRVMSADLMRKLGLEVV